MGEQLSLYCMALMLYLISRNLDKVLSLFSQFIDDKNELLRFTGKVDVLIGYSYARFHPSHNLLLLSNQFGKCLGGSHPSLVDRSRKVINNVAVHHVLGKYGCNGCSYPKVWKMWMWTRFTRR